DLPASAAPPLLYRGEGMPDSPRRGGALPWTRAVSSTPKAKPQGSPRSSLWRAGALVGGRYRLRAPIGAGAMGEVWRADHVTLGTTVAVKLIDTAHREDAAETLARFQQEAWAAAQLRSPH